MLSASPGVGGRSPLPPPSQPPPPPPPAMMMMPSMQMSSSGLDNSNNPISIGNPNVGSSSLNRRGLSGAPPRIRDYSEYGIPTSTPNAPGIGGSVQQVPQGLVAMSTAAGGIKQIPQALTQQTTGYGNSTVVTANNNNNNPGGGVGGMRYREGQA